MGLMIKLFIEDVKNELNVVVWNNVTDDMKLDQILPNPIACLNVPLYLVSRNENDVVSAKKIQVDSIVSDSNQDEKRQSATDCGKLRISEANEILINDDLDTYHQSPILNSDTNKVQTKRLPDNEFSKKPGVEIRKNRCESLSNFQDYLDYVKNKFVSIEKNRKARRCRKKKLKHFFSEPDHVKSYTNKRSFEEISKLGRSMNNDAFTFKQATSVTKKTKNDKPKLDHVSFSNSLTSLRAPVDDSVTDICTTAESQLASFCNPSDKVKKKMEEELSERILKEQDYKIICNAKDTETECEVFSEVKSPTSSDVMSQNSAYCYYHLRKSGRNTKSNSKSRKLHRNEEYGTSINRNYNELSSTILSSTTKEDKNAVDCNKITNWFLANLDLDSTKEEESCRTDYSFLQNEETVYYLEKLNDQLVFNRVQYYIGKHEMQILKADQNKLQLQLNKVENHISRYRLKNFNIAKVEKEPVNIKYIKKKNFHKFGIPYFKSKSFCFCDPNEDLVKMILENEILSFQFPYRFRISSEDISESDHNYSTTFPTLDSTYFTTIHKLDHAYSRTDDHE